MFVGKDPTGKPEIIKKTIGEMSQAELRGWYNADPQTASLHMILTPEKKTYEPIKENPSSPESQ